LAIPGTATVVNTLTIYSGRHASLIHPENKTTSKLKPRFSDLYARVSSHD